MVVCGRGRYAVTGLKICGCCAFLLAGNASSIRPPNGIVLRGWWDGQTGILRKKQTNGDETDKTARWRILPCVCVYGVLVYPWSCSSGSVQSLFGMNQPMTFSVCVCVCLGGDFKVGERKRTKPREKKERKEKKKRCASGSSGAALKKSHTERQDKQDNSKQAATTSDTTQRLKNKKPATDTHTHTRQKETETQSNEAEETRFSRETAIHTSANSMSDYGAELLRRQLTGKTGSRGGGRGRSAWVCLPCGHWYLSTCYDWLCTSCVPAIAIATIIHNTTDVVVKMIAIPLCFIPIVFAFSLHSPFCHHLFCRMAP